MFFVVLALRFCVLCQAFTFLIYSGWPRASIMFIIYETWGMYLSYNFWQFDLTVFCMMNGSSYFCIWFSKPSVLHLKHALRLLCCHFCSPWIFAVFSHSDQLREKCFIHQAILINNLVLNVFFDLFYWFPPSFHQASEQGVYFVFKGYPLRL